MCVRPDLITSSNSRALPSKARISSSAAGMKSRIKSKVAIRIEVGKTSLVDWAMLTWSLGLQTA
jgi:hypothetical protein